jgi:hypothetical protein
MALTFAIRLLEMMFVVGVIGCALVLVLTTIEDVGTLFGRKEKQPTDSRVKELNMSESNPATRA